MADCLIALHLKCGFAIIMCGWKKSHNIDGERSDQSELHSISVFGRAGDFVLRNIQKGTIEFCNFAIVSFKKKISDFLRVVVNDFFVAIYCNYLQ